MAKSKKRVFRLGGYLLLLTLAGILWFYVATTGHVQVLDGAGKPVEGANVHCRTLSMDGAVSKTDINGKASVDQFFFQSAKWMVVSKVGFQTRDVDISSGWPSHITINNGYGAP